MSLDAPQSDFDEGAAYRRVLNSQRDYRFASTGYADLCVIAQTALRMPDSVNPLSGSVPVVAHPEPSMLKERFISPCETNTLRR